MKKKRVLFVCVENSCRSQMAEGFARALGQNVMEAYSAGSRPSGIVSPDAITVMREMEIDISQQKSKGFSVLPFKKFDYVVTLGCGDQCPFVPADKQIDWNIEDPQGTGIESFRKTRNQICEEVILFIRALNGEIFGRG